MICLDDENGKGSCRSYSDFNLFDALSACSEHLVSFGGHAFAAGLNIKAENIGSFRKALAEYYSSNPPTEHLELEPEVLICDPSSLNMEGVETLSELEPCGSGNEQAMLCIFGAVLESFSSIGNGKHLRLRISKMGVSFDCVFFSRTAETLGVSEGETVDICFTPQINEFRQHKSVQLLITDIRKSEISQKCRDIIEKDDLHIDGLRVFRPQRDELVSLWRCIKNLGGRLELGFGECLKGNDLDSMEPVKLCFGIRILSELSLLEMSITHGRLTCCARDNVEKTELSKSPLFQRLWS